MQDGTSNMKTFDTTADMVKDRPRKGQVVETFGNDTLLDGGNARYYVMTLADYGGTAPTPGSVDKSFANGNVAVKMASEVTPQGAIMMYSGSVLSIPEGWSVCDGTNGTPDLRDRFVVGSGGMYTTGDTGGTANIELSGAKFTGSTVLTPAQNHHLDRVKSLTTTNLGNTTETVPTDGTFSPMLKTENNDGKGSDTALQFALNANVEGHRHSLAYTGLNQNLPPFYALMFIMKTGVVGQVLLPVQSEGLSVYEGVSGDIELDAVSGAITVFEVTPDANITNISIVNLPTSETTAYAAAIKIISDGSSTVSWDGSFNWENDTAPTLTTTAGSWDWITCFTTNQGVVFDATLTMTGMD